MGIIISLVAQKGGSGKSALSQNLAAFIAKTTTEVLLIDADPQRTTADWAEERQKNDLSPLLCVPMTRDIYQYAAMMAKKYAYVIIDTPGADSGEVRDLFSVSDVVVFPFRPRRRDLRTAKVMGHYAEVAAVGRPSLKVFSIVTQAPNTFHSTRVHEAKEILTSFNLNPLTHYTRYLNSWDDSEDAGQSVFDFSGDRKAAFNAADVFTELMEKIECQSAPQCQTA